jgi:hypothetical protein
VSSLKLTGISVSKRQKNLSPDYQFTIRATDMNMVETDRWLKDIGHHLICIYDYFVVHGSEVESRIVLFEHLVKIEFIFLAGAHSAHNENPDATTQIQYFGQSLSKVNWNSFSGLLANYN